MADTWKDERSPRRFAEMSANVQVAIKTLGDDVPDATAQVFPKNYGKHAEWNRGVVDDDRENWPNERSQAIRGGKAYVPDNNDMQPHADGILVSADLGKLVQMVKEIEGLPAVEGPVPVAAYKGLFPGLWLEFQDLHKKGYEAYRADPNANPPQSRGRHTFAELLANIKYDEANNSISHPFWLPGDEHARERHRLFLDELGRLGAKGEREKIEKVLEAGDNWTGGMQGPQPPTDNGMDPAGGMIRAAADVVIKLAKEYELWALLDGHFRASSLYKPVD